MLNRDFRDILSEFIAADVRFLVVGAYAVAAHGLPRATGDLDFWVSTDVDNAVRILEALDRFGTPLEGLTIADLQEPGVVIQIGREPSRVDIMTSIDGVDFDRAWTQRITISLAGLDVPILGREHLLINKRATGRPQDLADAARLEARTERPDEA